MMGTAQARSARLVIEGPDSWRNYSVKTVRKSNYLKLISREEKNVDNHTIDLIETLLNEAPAALLFYLGFSSCRCFEDGRY